MLRRLDVLVLVRSDDLGDEFHVILGWARGDIWENMVDSRLCVGKL